MYKFDGARYLRVFMFMSRLYAHSGCVWAFVCALYTFFHFLSTTSCTVVTSPLRPILLSFIHTNTRKHSDPDSDVMLMHTENRSRRTF